MFTLKAGDIIGEGTARVVYKHPEEAHKCIKVALREKLILKKKRRGLRALFSKPSRFDPTVPEAKIFRKIERKLGSEGFRYIPQFYGMVETNLGIGSVFDKIGDQNLEAYIEAHRFDTRMEEKLTALRDFFIRHRIHFSDWRPSNFVVREKPNNSDYDIVAVDGFEYTEFISISRIAYFSRRKILRRSAKMIAKLRVCKPTP